MQGQADLGTLSYSLGLNVGSNLKSNGFDEVDAEQFMQGLKEAFGGNVTKEQLDKSNAVLQAYMQEKQAKEAEVQAKAGADFLAENAKREGVVTLPSGLQYEIVEAGSGPKALDGDQVTTHYTGRFIDGKVFDSSVERGQPATFGVNQVIKGWTEALKLMPEGSKWKLYIPYDLAYGAQGRPGIPAYSTLIFDIELIDVVGK